MKFRSVSQRPHVLLNLQVGAAQFVEHVCYFYLYLSNMQTERGMIYHEFVVNGLGFV